LKTKPFKLSETPPYLPSPVKSITHTPAHRFHMERLVLSHTQISTQHLFPFIYKALYNFMYHNHEHLRHP